MDRNPSLEKFNICSNFSLLASEVPICTWHQFGSIFDNAPFDKLHTVIKDSRPGSKEENFG